MVKRIFILVLLSIIYYLLNFSFEKLSQFIFVRDEFLSVNLDYFSLIDTFISLVLICFCFIYINKTSIKKEVIALNCNHLFWVLIIGILYRVVEDPFLRIKFITGELIIPESINSESPSYFNIIIVFINVVVLTPILEELFFRKILLSQFFKKHIIIGVLLSSIVFAIIHDTFLNDYIRLWTFFTFGIISSIIYLRYGLLYSIIFHFIYNLIWYVSTLNLVPYWEILGDLNFGFIYWTLIIISIMLLLYISFKNVRIIINKNSLQINK